MQNCSPNYASLPGLVRNVLKIIIQFWRVAVGRSIIIERAILTRHGSQIRLAKSLQPDSVSVSSTVWRSNVERLMTLSTSAVAVCCWSDSRSSLEQSRVLDGDDGLIGKRFYKLDLFPAVWLRLGALKQIALQLSTLPQQRHCEGGPAST